MTVVISAAARGRGNGYDIRGIYVEVRDYKAGRVYPPMVAIEACCADFSASHPSLAR